MDSDTKLIEEYFDGNEKALGKLIARHMTMVYGFVFRMVGNQEEALDIVQETFVKVWKHLKKFNLERNFKTWVLSIARNSAIDYFRKRKDLKFSQLDDSDGEVLFSDSLKDLSPLPDELFEKKELGEFVRGALEKLTPARREVILLHDYSDLTFEEIAEILKKPMNTVKSDYRRAILALRENLGIAP